MQRQWYLDFLRIGSIFAVVIIHVAAQYWYDLDVGGFDWNVLNIYDSLVRWAVPVFVMISGALFLDPDKEQPLKKLWSKNILKIVVVVMVWGLVYALLYSPMPDFSLQSTYDFLATWSWGHYHMWFLFMILGLYVMVPILRCITKSQKATIYFLAVAFVLNILIPFLATFGHLTLLTRLMERMRFEMPMGYSFYFVLGYWLTTVELKSSRRKVVYGAGILGAIGTAALTAWLSNTTGGANETYYSYFSLLVCIAAVAVFLAARECFGRGWTPRWPVGLKRLSGCILGVYLVHIIVLNWLASIGFDSVSFCPLIAVPILALAVFAISLCISLVLSRLPIVGKWIV